MQTMKTMRPLLLGVAGLALAGCARGAQTAIDPDAPTIVVVDNQAFPDMTIYVFEGARRVRLGIANGHAQTRFTIPKYLVRNLSVLRFQADPIGGRATPFSDEITVVPGDELLLRIPPG